MPTYGVVDAHPKLNDHPKVDCDHPKAMEAHNAWPWPKIENYSSK
jgi:hypothetical protein